MQKCSLIAFLFYNNFSKQKKLEFNVSSNEIMRENTEQTTSNVKLVSSNEMKCETPLQVAFRSKKAFTPLLSLSMKARSCFWFK